MPILPDNSVEYTEEAEAITSEDMTDGSSVTENNATYNDPFDYDGPSDIGVPDPLPSDPVVPEEEEDYYYVTYYNRGDLTDYEPAYLQELAEAGCKFYAIYDDETEVEIQWTEIEDLDPLETEIDISASIAAATNQHFWDDTNGVHVAEVAKEDWQTALEAEFSDLSSSKNYYNILMNSLGLLLRRANFILTSINRASISFYDGLGNETTNIMASFGRNSAQIGRSNDKHVVIDNSGLTAYNSDGTLAPLTGTFDGANINNSSITNAKIVDGTIEGTKIASATIDNSNIKNGTIEGTKIASATIDNSNIKNGTIEGTKIASATIDNSNIKNGTITGAKIADGTIENTDIKNGTITGTKIAESTIENSNIKDGTITGTKIQGATLTDIPYAGIADADIEVARVANAEIAKAEVNYAHITNGVIDNAKIDKADVNGLAATYATITNLNAATARIGSLEAADVTINGRLDTAEADIDDLEAEDARIGNLVAQKASITDLNAATARIDDLEADHVSVEDFEAEQANIDTLQANTADIATIRANSAKVQNLTAAQLEADHATVGSLSTTYATITNLNAATGRISDLESTRVRTTDLEANYITADTIEANYTKTDLSNTDVAWIQNGTIKDGAISNAMIGSLSASKLTAGTINGNTITVTNLNADNITAGTLNGQRIGEGSLSLSKLEEDVYTESEVDSIVSNLQTQIDGAIETWTGTAVPTLNNSPASGWTTNAIKDTHVGDVYFVVNSNSQQNGYNYRFTKSGSTYSWQLIKDSDVTNALQRLTTAEGKIGTIEQFDSDISSWKTDTDEELASIKSAATTLAGRVTTAEGQIATKVETSTFNTLSQTVDSNTSSINQLSTETTSLATKVDSQNPFIVGTQTAQTGNWTGEAPTLSSLVDGQQITYWLPFAPSGNASLNLTLKDGTTTGAIPCYYGGTSRLTTHYAANNAIHLTYRTNISGIAQGWWADANYDSNSPYTKYSDTVIAGKNGLKRYTLCMRDDAGNFTSIVNQANNTNVSGKTCYTGGLQLGSVCYHATGGDYAAGANSGGIWESYGGVDFRYSVNGVANATSTELQLRKPVYLVGTIGADGLFYLDTTKWWTQTSFVEGKTYILVGTAYSNYYAIFVAVDNPTYIYENDELVEIQTSRITKTTNKVNTVSDTVDEHTRKIGLLETSVESKADGSTVETMSTKLNTVSDTVDGHTQSISSITSTQTTMQGKLDKTLVETTQLWFSKANTTAPNKPTAQVTSTSTEGNAWRVVVPAYNASYPNYYYCYQWKYSDGTYGWSSVTRDIAMGESQERARTAITNAAAADTKAGNAASAAATAQSTADTANSNASAAVSTANTANSNASTALSTANTAASDASDAKADAATAVSTANTASTNASTALSTANTASTNASTAVSTANTAKSTADTAKATADKNVKSTTQLWYTKANETAPAKPTTKVTSTAVSGNAWRIVVPTYASDYPYYFYCYQYELADGTFTWSDVVYDRATTENQANSRSAVTGVSTLTTKTNDIQDTVDGHTQSLQSVTSTQTSIQQNAVKSTVQLWFTKANTTAPNKPTAHVTTNNAATGNAWNLAVPTYNASYPNYYYCYEYQYLDGSYGWSAVTRDIATGEMQERARTAITNAAAADTKAGNAATAAANAQADIDGLEIGGRNLVTKVARGLATDAERTYTRGGRICATNVIFENRSLISERAGDTSIPYTAENTDGAEITLSFECKLAEGGISRSLQVYGYQNTGLSVASGLPTITPTNEWQKYVGTGIIHRWTTGNGSTVHGSYYSPEKEGGNQTRTNGEIWIYDQSGTNYFTIRNVKIEKGNRATDWSPAPEDVDTDISTAQTAADTAQATADKNVKESVQLWFTKANGSAPSKPTSAVTSTSTSGNAWTTKVPTYSASYPHYFYCMQYKLADGTYTWSDVVYDQATTEAQSVARTTSTNLSTLQQDYATFKQTTQNFESTIGSTYATKTEVSAVDDKIDNLEIPGAKNWYANWPRSVSMVELGYLSDKKYIQTNCIQDFSKNFCMRSDFIRSSDYTTQRYCLASSYEILNESGSSQPMLGIEIQANSGKVRLYSRSDTGSITDTIVGTAPDTGVVSTIVLWWNSEESTVTWLLISGDRSETGFYKPSGTFTGKSGCIRLGADSRVNNIWNVKYYQRDIPPVWYSEPQESIDNLCKWFCIEKGDGTIAGVSSVECASSPKYKYVTSAYKSAAPQRYDKWLQWGQEGTTLSNFVLASTSERDKLNIGDLACCEGKNITDNKPIYIVIEVTSFSSTASINGISHGLIDPEIRSTVNAIESRVTNAETSITQTNQQIALKANASDVYTKTQTDGLISTEVSNRNSAIEQSAAAINLSVSQNYTTKTESKQLIQPNLTPFFAQSKSSTVYWKNSNATVPAVTSDWSFEQDGPDGLGGWAHLSVNNTSGNTAYALANIDKDALQLKASTKYTFLLEWANVTISGSSSFYATSEHGGTGGSNNDFFSSTAMYPITSGSDTKYYAATTRAELETNCNNRIRAMISIGNGTSIDGYFRLSVYEGDYTGSYKPYIGTQLYPTETELNDAKAEIKVTTDGITSTVEKINSAKYLASSISGWSLASIKSYASYNTQTTFQVTSTNDARVGDTVYIKGTDTTRNCTIYIKGVVKTVNSATSITIYGRGYEDILPVESIKSTINQSSDSVKIQAKHVEIDGAAIFSNSAFKAAADAAYDAKGSASAVQINLDNLEIGGRNLLLNSKLPIPTLAPYSNSVTSKYNTPSLDGVDYYYCSGTRYWRIDFPTLISGETYNLWFDIARSSDSRPVFVKIGSTEQNIGTALGRAWKRLGLSFVASTATYAEIRVAIDSTGTQNDYIAALRNVKLEKGTKATDWTPAPEDVNADISAAESSAKGYADTKKTEAISAAATDATNKANAAEANAKGYADEQTSEAYEKIRSQGIQLVTNGNGFMGDNTNFSWWTFDGSRSNGSPGSFTHAPYNTMVATDEMFPVDTAKDYMVEFDTFSTGSGAHPQLYAMLLFYDVDKQLMNVQQVSYIIGSTTTLARELKNGDTVIYLTDASGFIDTSAAHQRSLIFWDYTNSFGYTYPPETYSRNFYAPSGGLWSDYSKINKSSNTITLTTAWTGGTKPAGTYLSQNSSGSTYVYFWSRTGTSFPLDEWTHASGIYSGFQTGIANVAGKFYKGCSYCKIGWLWNYQNSSSNPQKQIWITNVSVKEAVATKAELNSVATTANNAAPKSSAIARTQRIYWRAISNTKPSANTTWLTTSGDGYGNWSLNVPQLTKGTTKYPYLFTAVQTQTVAQQAAGTACSCSAVTIDDSTTVIDGGKIITGSVSANAINASSGTFDTANIPDLNASKITSGTIDAARIAAGSIAVGKIDATSGTFNMANIPALTADHIKANVINAVNNGTGTINADKINASNLTIGYSQLTNPPTIPSKVSDLTNDSGFQTSSQVDTAITSKGYATTTQAQGYATIAETNAKSYADTKKTEAITASYANMGFKYKKDIVVYGDSDKYYPVYLNNDQFDYSQSVPHEIVITRGYSEQAPSDWNTATHKGSLNLRLRWNYGGWGGATYVCQIYDFSEMYSTMLGDVLVGNKSGMNSTIYLRGGGTTGAIYHIYSEVAIDSTRYDATFPYIGTNTGDTYMTSGSYTWKVDNPLTTPNRLHILSLAAVVEEQYIYRSAASGTTSMAVNETWVTANGEAQNVWTTKRPVYDSSYPVLFVAKQRKLAFGLVTCTTPVKDDTTTIIDGGHITTGTIDADRISTTVINAINANVSDTINANKINASSLTIGYSQLTNPPSIPTKVSELTNDSNFVNSNQLATKSDKTLPDTRNDNQPPSWYISTYPRQSITEFKFANKIGFTSAASNVYCTLTTIVPWNDASGGYPTQSTIVSGVKYYRVGTGASTWSDWSAEETAAGAQAKADAKDSAIAAAAKRTDVAIAVTAIDYDLGTATLQATLYVDGTATTSNVTYKWLKDGSVVSGQTARTLSVTAAMGLSHVYSCTVTYS